MKTCSKCGVEKPLESFYRYHARKDGHVGVCKRCWGLNLKRREQVRKASNRWLWMAEHSGR